MHYVKPTRTMQTLIAALYIVHMSHVNQSAPLPQLDLISVQLICEKICTHLQNQFLASLFKWQLKIPFSPN